MEAPKGARKRSKDCSDEEMKRLMHLGQVRRREAVKANVREGKVSISHGAAKCWPVCLWPVGAVNRQLHR